MALISCPECQKEISDRVKSCPHCGFPMIEEEDASNNVEDIAGAFSQNDESVKSEDPKGEKSKSIQKKGIFVIGIMILLVVFVLYYFNNNSYGKFVNAIKNGNTEEAVKIFNELENNKSKEKIENYLIKESSDMKDKFINNSINYGDFNDKLKKIETIGIINEKISEDRKFIKSLHDSRVAYAKIVKYLEEGKFKDAIDETKNVIKEDINYNAAIEYKNGAMAKLEGEIISKSNELTSKNDFIGAINLLDDNKSYVTNKNTIEDLIKEYKKGASNEIIRKSIEKAELENYDEALDILNSNVKYSSNNNIQEKVNEIKQKKKEHDKNIVLDIKKRIVTNYDDVEKRYTIAPKGYSTRYVNISRVINIEPKMMFENSPTFAVNIGFHQKDWIFFEKAIFSIDGIRTEWDINYFDRGSQVGDGVYEWYFVMHDDLIAGYVSQAKNLKPLIESIIGSKDATIRFQGTGYRDHKITDKEKQTLKDLWNLYIILEEEPNLFELLK